MSLHWACPTEVYAGAGMWASAWRSRQERELVVADARLDLSVDGARMVPVDARAGTVEDITALAARIGEVNPRTVIGVGGGSVLDQVKLACLMHADPRMSAVLDVRGRRSGLVLLPPGPPRGFRLVLVPSTIGTGVEVSAVACVVRDGFRRLVAGPQLRADAALIDPYLTASLQLRAQIEGVLEALLRVAGPFVGSPHRGGLPDAESELLVRRLVAAGERLVTDGSSAELRLECSLLSATTHTGLALVGLERYAAKHWFIANEVASVLGVRKMVATVAVLPAIWERVLAGDERFGHAAQLRRMWSWAGDSDPVDGLRALLTRWGITDGIELTAGRCAEIAHRSVTAWGGRLPMLAGLGVADVEGLFQNIGSEEEISA